MIHTHDLQEQDLINLGFEMTFVSKHEHGGDNDFYYYTLKLFSGNGPLLISNSSDEVINNKWIVELFDYYDYYFDDILILTNFITASKNAKRKNIYEEEKSS
jgi:hypothetical protein